MQKFLELKGRHVQFLSDVQLRAIRDMLDALMKEWAQAGVGMHVRRAEIISEKWRVLYGKRDCSVTTVQLHC